MRRGTTEIQFPTSSFHGPLSPLHSCRTSTNGRAGVILNPFYFTFYHLLINPIIYSPTCDHWHLSVITLWLISTCSLIINATVIYKHNSSALHRLNSTSSSTCFLFAYPTSCLSSTLPPFFSSFVRPHASYSPHSAALSLRFSHHAISLPAKNGKIQLIFIVTLKRRLLIKINEFPSKVNDGGD